MVKRGVKPVIDLAGRRVGRLTVVARAGTIVTPTGQKQPIWTCHCDCGKTVVVRGLSLRSETTKSCGCLIVDTTVARSTKHGHAKRGAMTQERSAWNGMKERCLNPRSGSYSYYGGRGVSVCGRWLHDYAAFFADMGPCPHGHSLDRIDVNGNYEPGNCRWASRKEQRVNQRGRATWVEAFGLRMNLTDAANRFNINRDRLRYRIESGWPHEFALTAPTQKSGPKKAA